MDKATMINVDVMNIDLRRRPVVTSSLGPELGEVAVQLTTVEQAASIIRQGSGTTLFGIDFLPTLTVRWLQFNTAAMVVTRRGRTTEHIDLVLPMKDLDGERAALAHLQVLIGVSSAGLATQVVIRPRPLLVRIRLAEDADWDEPSDVIGFLIAVPIACLICE